MFWVCAVQQRDVMRDLQCTGTKDSRRIYWFSGMAGGIEYGVELATDGTRVEGGKGEGTQARAAIARLRLGHTTLGAHLHHLHLSSDPFCPWCRTTPETIGHFLLHCSRFHSHHNTLCSRLSTMAMTKLDLPILLASSGVHVHPSR
ncbi:hypothetical protein E2C01_061510 [Portunus trituberculatus]|uniref:Reverse transcriptase zinc-binding domain-containing protein n=1 Tax=Portunus trituberculatus TaxID=210409 RepID=A0A5B7HBG5_PORTR|nr:hypothetical protein [Portunus trituberculatus]